MTTSVANPYATRPGELIGHRKDGRPIRLIAGAHTNPNTSLIAYRGRDDSQTLNSATFTHALNTPWTQDVDLTFRVRFAFEENAGAPAVVGATIEASRNGGAFQAVTTASTIVKAVTSAQFADDAATSDLGLGGAGGFVAGRGSETGDPTDVSLTSQHSEYEYALQIVGADVADGDIIVIRPAGLVSYATSAGASITANKTLTTVGLGQPAETESVQVATIRKIVALQMVRAQITWDETPATWDGLAATWDFGELETSRPAAPLRQVPASQPTEIETAQPVTLGIGGGQTIPLGLITETETSQPITVRETVTLAQPSETETAQPVTARESVALGQPVETETAQPMSVGGTQVITLGLVVETETAHTVTVTKAAAVGQPSEVEAAQTVLVLKRVTLAQLVETETAQAMVAGTFLPDPNPHHAVFREPSTHSVHGEASHAVYRETSRDVYQTATHDIYSSPAHDIYREGT